MRCKHGLAILALTAACSLSHPSAASATTRIVIIGGIKSEGPARHDYPNGVRLLNAFLLSSPDVKHIRNLVIDSYPDGWPADPAALEGASTVVWYFDGLQRHPLLDAARREAFEALMKRGVGLVALHQAATVPEDDRAIGLSRWLGVARFGMFDRTTQDAQLKPVAHSHSVTRGVKPFVDYDEYYPTYRRHRRGQGLTSILRGRLQAEFRQGRELADDAPAMRNVAWAFERTGGGRAFTFSGAHHLTAFDQPELRKLLLNAILWTANIAVPRGGVRSGLSGAATRLARAQTDTSTFHRDPQRTGWNSHETTLTPETVGSGRFGALWSSPQFDGVGAVGDLGGPGAQAPRVYASPLYVDQVRLSAGLHKGVTFPVVIVATNAGFVYAINAFQTRQVAAGTILWRTRLGAPCRLQPAPLDGVPTGVLSTPVIDLEQKRIYVTHCDPDHRWQAYALDLASGTLVAGWPVRLDEATLNTVNKNAGLPVAPARRFDFRVQRAALNLSPDGAWLYIGFGETETGWMVAVDTAHPRIASAFAAQAAPYRGGGGIWGAGGPAVDADGNVFVVTGTGYNGFIDRSNDWTQSVMMLSHSQVQGFVLRGTYTPFNHCATATMDIDLGSGGVTLLPDIDAAATTTPRLLVVGGKQGNAYLVDRARLPGHLERRPPCSDDSASDASLLAPETQPQFGRRGPLNVFGPYSESDAAMDLARARSVPATFRAAAGETYVFMTGSTRKDEGTAESIPPSLVRLEVVTAPGRSAYLSVNQREMRHAFENPGSPFVTSNGPRQAIVWVLDENARRSAPLAGPNPPQPVLYAFDAMNLSLVWKSAPGELFTSGKYNEPAFARGTVFVATDRLQAFGLGGQRAARAADTPVTVRAAPAEVGRAAGTEDGGVLYDRRCAACHDHPQGSIPPREVIVKRTREHIVDTLTRGAMRPFAEGLSAHEIEAIAGYLR